MTTNTNTNVNFRPRTSSKQNKHSPFAGLNHNKPVV